MSQRALPVESSERIESLDVLRGVALLGILLMNIRSFAMPGAAYMNPTAYGDLTGVNWGFWLMTEIFADQKFMALFSMLFGAGVCLFADRAAQKATAVGRLHHVRMFWLLLFGLAHAHLLWFGDILVPYAVSGCVVFWFRNRSPRVLLIAGVAFLLVPVLMAVGAGLTIDAWPEEQRAEMRGWWHPSQQSLSEELATYRLGWVDQLGHRSEMALMFETMMLLQFFLWRASGMMLIGMMLYRLGVLSCERSNAYYRNMILIGGGLGLTLTTVGAISNIQAGFDWKHSMFLGGQWNYVGSIGIALAYCAGVMLLVRSSALRGLVRRLGSAGQMAFTNYLLQTVICTLIFYGHGLGYFGQAERWQQALVVLGVWAVMLVLSPWWLARFRFGPMEWLWRSLTYWRRQPMRL